MPRDVWFGSGTAGRHLDRLTSVSQFRGHTALSTPSRPAIHVRPDLTRTTRCAPHHLLGSLLGRGLYALQLQPWLEAFGTDQIKVLFLEEVVQVRRTRAWQCNTRISLVHIEVHKRSAKELSVSSKIPVCDKKACFNEENDLFVLVSTCFQEAEGLTTRNTWAANVVASWCDYCFVVV